MPHKLADMRRLKEIEVRARWVCANYPPKGERTAEQQKEINDLAVEALMILGRLNELQVY